MKRRRLKEKFRSYLEEAGEELGYFRHSSEIRSFAALKELWKRITKKRAENKRK
ncbi:hypothetical protein [Salibacterium sp. K-3]